MARITTDQGSRYAAVLGIGSYRPSRVVPNAHIVDAIDSSDEWIQQRSGIKQRRFATPEETVQVMSVGAARSARGRRLRSLKSGSRPSCARRIAITRAASRAGGRPASRWCAYAIRAAA